MSEYEMYLIIWLYLYLYESVWVYDRSPVKSIHRSPMLKQAAKVFVNTFL